MSGVQGRFQCFTWMLISSKAITMSSGTRRGIALAVADLLRTTCRRGCDTVARYGGEEFGIILPETDAAGAEHVARTLVKSLHALAFPHPKGINDRLTVSIGVACFVPAEGLIDQSVFLRAVDQALYRAKDEGRNRHAMAPGFIPGRKGSRRTAKG